MISIDNLKVEFGIKPLFSDVSFVVNDRDKIALVGLSERMVLENQRSLKYFVACKSQHQEPSASLTKPQLVIYHKSWSYRTTQQSKKRHAKLSQETSA